MSQAASIDQRVLKLVTKAGAAGIMPRELQQRLGVGSATITRHLRDLEANRKVVRPTPKGPVYAPEFVQKTARQKAAPSKPRRQGSQARRADEPDALSRALQWMGEHKVITGGFGLAMVLGLSRPDRVRSLMSRSMSLMTATGPDGANLVEKMQAVVLTEAVRQLANANSPENLKAEYAAENQRLAENYAQSWNVRLQELERTRGVMHRLIYEGSPEEQAHFFLAAGVLLPEPGGPGGLGLRRA